MFHKLLTPAGLYRYLTFAHCVCHIVRLNHITGIAAWRDSKWMAEVL